MQITGKSLKYVFNSKRRLMKVVVYAVYLYLFCQRIFYIVRYFRNIATGAFCWIFRTSKKDAQQTLLRRVLLRMLKTMLFVYNAFILAQLCCIGYAESHRVTQIYHNIVNQAKRVRIRDRL